MESTTSCPVCFGLRNADFSCAVEKVVGLCFPCLSLICAKMWYDAGEALTGILGVQRSAPVDLPYVLGQVLNLLQLLKAFQLVCLYLKAVCLLLNLSISKCKSFRAWYLALQVLSTSCSTWGASLEGQWFTSCCQGHLHALHVFYSCFLFSSLFFFRGSGLVIYLLPCLGVGESSPTLCTGMRECRVHLQWSCSRPGESFMWRFGCL